MRSARSSNAFRRAFYQAWDASEGRQIWAALFILLRFSDLVFRTVKLELDGRPPEVRPRSPFAEVPSNQHQYEPGCHFNSMFANSRDDRIPDFIQRH